MPAAVAKVFIDDEGIIYDASLNQTNISGNNNKVSGRVGKAKVLAEIPSVLQGSATQIRRWEQVLCSYALGSRW